MSTTAEQILQSHLEDAIAAERAMENRFKAFSSEGDDDDVRNAFAVAAEQARTHSQVLSERLPSGSSPSAVKTIAAQFFAAMPLSAQLAHIQEERTVQNLIVAYTLTAGACGLHESLSTVARAAGDTETFRRARAMQASQSKLAERFYHFIPTRSIIAYNMLTLEEVNPAVQTKLGEASWT